MDIPSLFMIPSAVSSGKVHSVFPNSTDADFDFNRDSDATRVNSEGLIERVGFYGSELITNGSFDTDSNWTKGTGWTISNGVASSDGSQSSNSNLYQVVYTVSKVYNTRIKVIAINGTLKVFTGTGAASLTITEVGEYEVLDKLADSSTVLYIQVTSGTTVTIDNVSVKEVLGDRARLNYEIEGGLVNTKPSLLLEPQSTNLITYSEDFSAYTTNNSSVSSNIVSSPDGSLSASKLIENTSTAEHTIQKSVSVTSGNAYSISVFVKKEEISSVQFGFTGSNFASPTRSIFDIENGTITTNVSNTASIENYGNGWYRLKVTNTANSTGTGMLILQSIKSGQANYAGDGVSGFYMWGLQWEQQSYSTSYIPTNGSTQTRAAETCNGAGTSSIFESTEGILYCEIQAFNLDGGLRYISIGGSTDTNRLVIRFLNTTGNISAFSYPNGAITSIMEDTSTNPLVFNKVAMKWKVNDFALWVNGNEVATDTSGATFASGVLDRLQFSNPQGTSVFYGKCKDIRVYNTKEMTDSEVDILLTKITS